MASSLGCSFLVHSVGTGWFPTQSSHWPRRRVSLHTNANMRNLQTECGWIQVGCGLRIYWGARLGLGGEFFFFSTQTWNFFFLSFSLFLGVLFSFSYPHALLLWGEVLSISNSSSSFVCAVFPQSMNVQRWSVGWAHENGGGGLPVRNLCLQTNGTFVFVVLGLVAAALGQFRSIFAILYCNRKCVPVLCLQSLWVCKTIEGGRLGLGVFFTTFFFSLSSLDGVVVFAFLSFSLSLSSLFFTHLLLAHNCNRFRMAGELAVATAAGGYRCVLDAIAINFCVGGGRRLSTCGEWGFWNFI